MLQRTDENQQVAAQLREAAALLQAQGANPFRVGAYRKAADTLARLVCAVPVAAAETLGKLKHYADEVVCLETPLGFHAVGQFYRDFRQVEDEEVVRLLAAA